MCGITGILYFDPHQPVDAVMLQRMTDSLAHRGPDDRGILVRGNLGLGFRRLSIIDLSASGHQPMSNEDDSVWLVFNGEIYNFPELRYVLESKGHRFKSRTDSEVILHAYEEYGSDCLDHLDGMFTFALWDSNSQTLLLARDRFGIKPLHYFVDHEKLIFGSEIKAILQDPSVPRRVNPQAFWNYLTFMQVPAPQTIYQGISKLLPGHALSVANHSLHQWRYWDLSLAAGQDSPKSEAKWSEELADLFRESVRRHLVADVPVGIFLSGGLDSSAIVAQASHLTTAPVSTFSISFDDHPAYDESPYQQQVAKLFGSAHHEIRVRPDILQIMDDLLREFDEPFAVSSAVPLYYISRLASEHVKVVLSGEGGDEIFAGYDWRYRRFRQLQYLNFMPAGLWRTVRHGLERWSSLAGRDGRLVERARKVAALGNLQPLERYLALFNFFSAEEKQQLIHPELLATIQQDHGDYYNLVLSEASGHGLEGLLYTDIKTSLADEMLTKVDRMTSMVSIEGRVPLLDRKFAETAFRIPNNLKLKGRTGKYIFKKAMERLLPRDLIWREKHGFNVPLGSWWQSANLQSLWREYVNEATLKQQQFFNPTYVGTLLNGKEPLSESQAHKLFIVLVFQKWLDLQPGVVYP
jgi:asparagine synthase (glutamine-hydrolysing)